MGVSSAEYTLEKTMTLGDFFAFIVPKIGCFSTNVFVKPNEQNRACSSYAMARKRRMKSNFFFVCDTCDSKKTTSLLEGARIYAREGLEGDKQSVDTRKQRYEYKEIREYKDTEKREGKRSKGEKCCNAWVLLCGESKIYGVQN